MMCTTTSSDQQQRNSDDVEREEAVQRDVGDVEIAADPLGEAFADHGHRAEQRHDDLRAPVGHVPPGQQIAEERLGHQAEVDEHADQPDQLARLLVRAVHAARGTCADRRR